MRRTYLPLLAAAALAVPVVSNAAVLYSEDFNVDPTANWTINNPALSDSIVNFNYDYSAIGVPSSNGSGTRGLKMTCNNVTGVFSGLSVSPTGQSFSGSYRVSFDMWQNYVGPLGPGGNGTTQLTTFGVGTSGTTAFWPGAAVKESVAFAATLDGGSGTDYRAYTSAAPTSYAAGNAVYQAPGGGINNDNVYYNVFTPQSAPAAQLGLFAGQTGSTDIGEMSFKWRKVVMEVDGGFATWIVDGLPIAKIDLSTVTQGGGNFFLGHSDTNAAASTAANDTLLNVSLFDNIVVESIPEPTAIAGLALAGMLLSRRNRKA